MIYRWIRCDLIGEQSTCLHRKQRQGVWWCDFSPQQPDQLHSKFEGLDVYWHRWPISIVYLAEPWWIYPMINHEIKISSASEGTISLMILKQWTHLIIINPMLHGAHVTKYQFSGMSCPEIQFMQGDEYCSSGKETVPSRQSSCDWSIEGTTRNQWTL